MTTMKPNSWPRKNPNPWPKIDNLSVWYAKTVNDDLLYNEQQEQQHLQQFVYAYEKLDGTNLGICCGGVRYGRRFMIQDGATTYQRVPIGNHNLPSQQTVQSIKASLIKSLLVGNNDSNDNNDDISLPSDIDDMSQLVLYGELICNLDRYGYDKRGIGSKWLCFGAMLTIHNDSSRIADQISIGLSNRGYLPGISGNLLTKNILLRLNPTLESTLEEYGIDCPVLVDQGLLKDVCLRQKGIMMESNLEGLVLTGEAFMKKWKTGVEDESSGLSKLTSILTAFEHIATDDDVLKSRGVDALLLRCLTEVARNGSKVAKTVEVDTYEQRVLDRATISALSKYDALSSYRNKGRKWKKWITNAIVKELIDDLGATSTDEIECIQRYTEKSLFMHKIAGNN